MSLQDNVAYFQLLNSDPDKELEAGTSFGQALRKSVDQMHQERTAAGAPEFKLRSLFQKGVVSILVLNAFLLFMSVTTKVLRVIVLFMLILTTSTLLLLRI